MPEHSTMRNADLPRLRSLQSEMPSKPIAQVRQAWPLVSAALLAGHTLKAIHQRLIEDGFEMSYQTLARSVHRLRLEEAEKRDRVSGVRGTPRSAGPSRTSPTPPFPSDPLARAIEACATSGYNVTAEHCNGDPSKKKLI